MGWLTNLLNKAWNWAWGGNAENPWTSLVNSFTGAGLTGAEQAANQFNAEQAALAYERQQEFYEKYQSIGAQVEQAKAAGVNPAALYGNLAGGSAPSVPQASGSVSPGSAHGIDTLLSLAQMAFNMKENVRLNDAEIANRAANARKQNADAKLAEIDAETRGELNNLRNSSLVQAIDKIMQDVSESESRAALNRSIESLNRADFQVRTELNELNVKYWTAVTDQETEHAKQYKRELQANIANTIAQTQFYNAEASQIRAYCKEMLSTFKYIDDKGDAYQYSSRIAKMTDEEINTIRKERSMMWTKGVDSISRGVATIVGAAFGTAAISRGGTRSRRSSTGANRDTYTYNGNADDFLSWFD